MEGTFPDHRQHDSSLADGQLFRGLSRLQRLREFVQHVFLPLLSFTVGEPGRAEADFLFRTDAHCVLALPSGLVRVLVRKRGPWRSEQYR